MIAKFKITEAELKELLLGYLTETQGLPSGTAITRGYIMGRVSKTPMAIWPGNRWDRAVVQVQLEVPEETEAVERPPQTVVEEQEVMVAEMGPKVALPEAVGLLGSVAPGKKKTKKSGGD